MSYTLAQQLFGTPGTMARCVLLVFITLLLAAAASDFSRQRIPNRLVWAGTALAILFHAVLPTGDGFISALPGGLSLVGSLTGFGVTLAVLLPLYFMRLFGAGDVKLLAMIGAFVGVPEIAWVVLFSALAGGLLVLAIAMHRRIVPAVLKNLKMILWHSLAGTGEAGNLLLQSSYPSARPVPYGVAIAAGAIVFVLFRAGQAGLLTFN